MNKIPKNETIWSNKKHKLSGSATIIFWKIDFASICDNYFCKINISSKFHHKNDKKIDIQHSTTHVAHFTFLSTRKNEHVFAEWNGAYSKTYDVMYMFIAEIRYFGFTWSHYDTPEMRIHNIHIPKFYIILPTLNLVTLIPCFNRLLSI